MSFTRPAALVAAIAIAASLLVAPPPATAQTPSGEFQDHADIATVHRQGVYALQAEGVVQGCADGLYCPSPAVTREQMATFIGRALGLPEDRSPRFEDVQPTSTHGGYIGALSEAGITTGCTVSPDEDGQVPEGDHFCPRDTVTREQMASFISRAYQLRGYSGSATPSFTDVTGGVHAAGIDGVAGALVTTGCTATEFCPRDDVTREQMASFIARAMGLLLSNRGCPTTVGPAEVRDDYGTASDETRFPVNAAERIGNRLFIFSIDIIPSRLVVDDLAANGSLSTGNVVRNVEVPTGRRTWATEVVGNDLYFGQDFTGSAPTRDLYRIGRNSGTPQRLTTVPGTEFWDMTSDTQGRLYIGTSNSQTVYRYTPGSGTSGRLDTLRFGGTGTTGQVTQLEYDAQDDTLYVGTGRFTAGSSNSARLLAIDEVSSWTPQTTKTARQLLPGGDPGLEGVSSIIPGVYSLEVTDDLIAVGFETTNARLVTLQRTEEPVDPPVDPVDPVDPTDPAPGDGTQTFDLPAEPENLDADPLGDGPNPEPDLGADAPAEPAQADPTTDDTSAMSTASATEGPAVYRVRDNVQLSGEGKVESVRIDPDTGTVFAAGATTGRIYRVTNPGDTPTTTNVQQLATPIPGAVNRNLFLQGTSLVGVASTGDVWSIDRTTGSQLGRNSPRNLVDAGATVGSQLPQSMAVGNGRVAIGANNAIFLHRTDGGPRRTVTAPGEPKAMTTVGDQLYGAMYPSGSVFRQSLAADTSGNYAPGTTVATWGGQYGRPRDIHFSGGPQNRMLIGARATSASANALISYQVPSSTNTAWPAASITQSPIPNQEVWSLATTASGSAILGGTGSSARVAARPTTGGSQQWSQVPVPGGGTVVSLAALGDQVHGLSQNGTWFQMDRRNGQVANTRRVLDGDAANMEQHQGWLYAVNRDCLVAIDTQRGRVETLQDQLNSRVSGGNHLVGVDPQSAAGAADTFVMREDQLIRVRHRQR